jgi:hypothetical protein
MFVAYMLLPYSCLVEFKLIFEFNCLDPFWKKTKPFLFPSLFSFSFGPARVVASIPPSSALCGPAHHSVQELEVRCCPFISSPQLSCATRSAQLGSTSLVLPLPAQLAAQPAFWPKAAHVRVAPARSR